MEIAEIFYLTATIVLVILGVLAIYVIYQIYLLKTFAKRQIVLVKRTMSQASLVRYSLQGAFLKTIVNLLGGGDKK